MATPSRRESGSQTSDFVCSTETEEVLGRVRREWATASSFSDFRGQVGGLGITAYHGLVARLGVQTAIPDPNILRFVQNAVGRPFTEQEVVEALNIVAQRLGVAPRDLDHSIWNLSANYEG